MAEHTKTPWHWECKEECERLSAYNRVGCLLSEDDTEVLWFGWDGEECIYCPNLADAEFIVQACNAYDADQAEIKRLRDALEHIIEYWNRDPNDTAMHDALWHIIETAEQALKQ